MRTLTRLTGGIGIMAAAHGAAMAQQPPQQADEIVVTSARRETSVRESPATISIVRRQDIERRGGSSVAELLRDVPGVQIDESGVPGMKRLRIRGEDARRSLVLIDGQEITDHTTYGPPMLIDPALIERIEVVRGPLSVLYGSRAIGGVINIITRRPSKKPVSLEFGAGYDSATRGHYLNSLASGTYGNFNYRLFLGRTLDTTRETPTGKLPNSKYDTRTLDMRLGYDNGTHALSFGYDRHELSSRSSTPPGTVDGVAFTKFQLDMPQRDREKFSVFYEGRDILPWLPRIKANAFHQIIDRRFTQDVAGTVFGAPPPGSYDYHHADTDRLRTTGATFQADFALLPKNTLTLGFQHLVDSQDKNTSRVGVLDPAGPVGPSPINILSIQKSSIGSTSLFAQNTWNILPGLQFVGGLRQYWITTKLEESNDPLVAPNQRTNERRIGSATLLWSPTNTLTLRAGWGQGYIVPTLLQLHTGTLFGSRFVTRPNPALRPETSNSYEIGARYSDGQYRIDATAFASNSRGYIASAPCSAVPGVTCLPGEYSYINTNAADTYGVELEGGVKVLTHFEAYGSLAYTRRKLAFPTYSTWQSGTPALRSRLGLRYANTFGHGIDYWVDAYMRMASEIELLSRSGSGAYTLSRTGGWTTLNLEFGGSWIGADPWGEHSLSVALTNLTDRRYRPALEELEQPGRAIRLNYRAKF